MQTNSTRVINDLSKKILTSRAQADVAFRWGTVFKGIPRQYEKIEGLWPSTIFLNLDVQSSTRNPVRKIFRKIVEKFSKCEDFNFYANIWIFKNIVEARELGVDLGFGEKELVKTWTVLSNNFRSPEDLSSPAVYFWPKIVPAGANLTKETLLPTNLSAKLAVMSRIFVLIAKIKRDLLSAELTSAEKRASTVSRNACQVPKDFDDSSLFIAADFLLKRNSHLYPDLSTFHSIDMEKFSQLLQRYGYRPFADDYSASTIDPRTYIWLRHFLEAHVQATRSSGHVPDMNLPCTWIQSIDEAMEIENSDCGGHVTPTYTNNVEGSVCANVLYAMTVAIASTTSLSWFDESLQKIYKDTSNMIAWLIESEMVNKRPDVVLLYYPDVEVFYYFVARVLKQLRSLDEEFLSMFPVLAHSRNCLEKAMQKVTIMLLNLANTSDDEEMMYWDGVLGKGRDRLFITSTCINALFDTWIVKTSSGKFQFLPDAPAALEKCLTQASNFLLMHATSGQYTFSNALFSASAKSIWSYPERYPCNTFQFTDGSRFNPESMSYDDLMASVTSQKQFVLGVNGFVPDREYQSMTLKKRFGLEQSTELHPFTKITYWSVEDVTRTMIILALAKCRSIE